MHAQYIYIVYAKYQSTSIKALLHVAFPVFAMWSVDFPTYAINMPQIAQTSLSISKSA